MKLRWIEASVGPYSITQLQHDALHSQPHQWPPHRVTGAVLLEERSARSMLISKGFIVRTLHMPGPPQEKEALERGRETRHNQAYETRQEFLDKTVCRQIKQHPTWRSSRKYTGMPRNEDKWGKACRPEPLLCVSGSTGTSRLAAPQLRRIFESLQLP